jgi:hypothetical protein
MVWTKQRYIPLSHEQDERGVTMSKSEMRLSGEILHCKHVCKWVDYGHRARLAVQVPGLVSITRGGPTLTTSTQ